VPDIQHVVSDTVNRAAVTFDPVIGIVALELSTELPILLTNRLMAAFPTPLRYRPKCAALSITSGLLPYEPLPSASATPIVGEAQVSHCT
jgi:hypothetical protein